MSTLNQISNSEEKGRNLSLTGLLIHTYMNFSLVWVWFEGIYKGRDKEPEGQVSPTTSKQNTQSNTSLGKA